MGGVDVQTEVAELDLFDFDMYVDPILTTLCGKSMDQGLTEVLQEQEMKLIKRHRQRFDQERGVTYAQAQRLESELNRGKAEVERRIKQREQKEAEDLKQEAQMDARTAAKQYYEDLQDTVMERLQEAGHFYDPTVSQVESTFIPWLTEKVARQLQEVQRGRDNLDQILTGAVSRG